MCWSTETSGPLALYSPANRKRATHQSGHMQNLPTHPEPTVLSTMRRLLLVLVTIGMLGTAADLLLLNHYENGWQMAPLALIAISLLVVAWVAVSGGTLPLVVMRAAMIGFIAAGCLGILLHYNGNSEFQREIDPSLAGWALAWKVMTAKAPPALAPASMIQLGLLGLLYTYRHPSVRPSALSRGSKGGENESDDSTGHRDAADQRSSAGTSR
jgi:hypothetical protein